MKNMINWKPLQTKHGGEWVALKKDEKTVLASGQSAKQVFEAAKKTGYKMPILTKVPKKLTPYIGYEICV